MALPRTALTALEVLLAIGTWSNGLALYIAALTGVSSPLCATMNVTHPPPAVGEGACHYLLLTCGATVVGALALALAGLARSLLASGHAKAA